MTDAPIVEALAGTDVEPALAGESTESSVARRAGRVGDQSAGLAATAAVEDGRVRDAPVFAPMISRGAPHAANPVGAKRSAIEHRRAGHAASATTAGGGSQVDLTAVRDVSIAVRATVVADETARPDPARGSRVRRRSARSLAPAAVRSADRDVDLAPVRRDSVAIRKAGTARADRAGTGGARRYRVGRVGTRQASRPAGCYRGIVRAGGAAQVKADVAGRAACPPDAGRPSVGRRGARVVTPAAMGGAGRNVDTAPTAPCRSGSRATTDARKLTRHSYDRSAEGRRLDAPGQTGPASLCPREVGLATVDQRPITVGKPRVA